MVAVDVKRKSKNKINIRFKGGGAITRFNPIFSSDEERIYICWKNKILAYVTRTGKLINEYKGLDDDIVGFGVQNVEATDTIVACSEKGVVHIWNSVTFFRVFNTVLECKKVTYFYLIPSENDVKQAFIVYEEGEYLHCARINLDTNEKRKFKPRFKARSKLCISTNSNGLCVVALKKTIYFLNLHKIDQNKSVCISGNKVITCVSCHHEEDIVIVGDSLGQVTLWQNIYGESPTFAIFHWHTLPVKCLTFSYSGSYFYSGGSENVAVRWEIDNNIQRQFLPRLSGHIEQLSASSQSQFLAITTSDNCVRIVDSRFNEISLIQQLVLGENYNCGIHFDNRTKALVMNGNVGAIQFYSPQDMSLLYNVNIVGQNRITDERETKIENTEVCKIALSDSGLWLSTVEERIDNEYFNEIRLKFWNFNNIKQTFELNTSIDYPHERSINNVKFQHTNDETNLRCVTVSDEKKFRIWQLTEVTEVNETIMVWECQCAGYYRDLTCYGLSFSMDGSLMAIGFGPILTTWLPDTCELKCSLVYPGSRDDIKHIEFGRHSLCHLIVSATKKQMFVWDLLSLTVKWTVPLNVDFLLSDSLTAFMAVVTSDNQVFIFTPDCSQPIYSTEDAISDKKLLAVALAPVQNQIDNSSKWNSRTQLFFLNENKELYSLGEEDIFEEMEEENEASLSLYSRIMPSQSKTSITPSTPIQHLFKQDPSQQALKMYLETPIHTLLPIRMMCTSILASMVIQKHDANNVESE